jgi:2-polyprenyl-3-methyl-5-hydroxy-6-metoxy-1,4-benzoquinol methylase
MNNRNYNEELKNTADRKYAYNFDFDVMHPYMIESFKPFFKGDDVLELGSSKGDFTKHLFEHFAYITCVEASNEAIKHAQNKFDNTVTFYNSLFEDTKLPKKYNNIILTHVLEHIDNPVTLLNKIKEEWLTDDGYLFVVCPNANAPSRQIAVKMGLISHNSAITPSEAKHGHRITYTLDTLERDAVAGGLKVVHRSGIFFKALANFQWDQLLNTDIISKEYLDGCYALGQQYPDLCSSIILVCKK